MSSLSLTEPARAPLADVVVVRAIALGALIAYAVFTQLDAVANKLSASLPLSITEMTLGALIGSTFLLFLLPDPQLRGRGTMGVRLVLAMLCWATFAWTMSEHVSEGRVYLTRLATNVVAALCVLPIVSTPGRMRLLLWSIVGAGAVSAAIVIVEGKTGTRLVSTAVAATTAGFEGVARSAGGSDQNPTTAAQMLLVSVLAAIGLLLSGERQGRVILAGIAGMGVLALIETSARSAILGLGAGTGLAMLRFRRERFFPLMVVAGVVAAVGAIPFLPPTLIDRFTAIGNFAQDPTLFRRVTYLRIGLDLISQSPLWGVGPGNYPLYYVTAAYRWMPGREPVPRELHNTYLDAATEYGPIGFLLFAAALGVALYGAWRAAGSPTPALARTGLTAGVMLAGLMVACFFMPHKDLRYLWLVVAIALQCGRLRAEEEAT